MCKLADMQTVQCLLCEELAYLKLKTAFILSKAN